MSSERAYDESYFCEYMGQKVRVDGYMESVTGLGSTVLVRQMTGCTGLRLCKKFTSPSAMQLPSSVGCPYHDKLHGH
ncbi:MAG TPA: hypothetical protein VKS60_14490 [Stellaceae bacterium]|nr:hypothetical protein [Stellaceae bacterium]